MRFIWDEAKRLSNLAKHGLDFVDVETLFAGFVYVVFDERHSEHEDRWIGIGKLGRDIIVVVIYTEPEEELIRVISLRKAASYERQIYEAALADRLGEVDAMKDEEIDFSDSPELMPEQVARGVLIDPKVKHGATVVVHVEPKLAAWYQRHGKDAEQRMRAALEIYATAHRNGPNA